MIELEDKLQTEIDFLNIKIDRYTNLLVDQVFRGENRVLLERYTARLLDKKLLKQRVLERLQEK